MLELELDNVKAVLTGVDNKPGKDGGRPFMLLSIAMLRPAGELIFFSPDLEEHYFDKTAVVEDMGGGSPLRDAHMVFPHKRDETMSGAVAKIEYGIGNPMAFPDAVIDQVQLTPKPGSFVLIECRVKVYPGDEVTAGRLFFMQTREIALSIEPIEKPQLAEAA